MDAKPLAHRRAEGMNGAWARIVGLAAVGLSALAGPATALFFELTIEKFSFGRTQNLDISS